MTLCFDWVYKTGWLNQVEWVNEKNREIVIIKQRLFSAMIKKQVWEWYCSPFICTTSRKTSPNTLLIILIRHADDSPAHSPFLSLLCFLFLHSPRFTSHSVYNVLPFTWHTLSSYLVVTPFDDVQPCMPWVTNLPSCKHLWTSIYITAMHIMYILYALFKFF